MSSSSSTTHQLSAQAVFYMSLLSIQFGAQPLLTKLYTPPSVCRSSVIIAQEVIKFVISLSVLVMSGNWSKAISGWTISSWIAVAFIPAALYSIQNMAALMAYQNLDPLTFNVLNQTKTLSAALCCYFIIGRKQSRMQIVSLVLLFSSALIIEKIIPLDIFFGKDSAATGLDENASVQYTKKHFTHGVAPVLLASLTSGLAGAMIQKNLQSASGCGKSGGRSSYLVTMELCVASVIFLTSSLVSSDDGRRISENGFFENWTPQTFIPIVANAAGGIIVGLVTKYAGSVRKGFALIFGLLISGVLQAAIESTSGEGPRVSNEQIIGGILASISLWMHSSNPYKAHPGPTIANEDTSKNSIPKKSRKARKED